MCKNNRAQRTTRLLARGDRSVETCDVRAFFAPQTLSALDGSSICDRSEKVSSFRGNEGLAGSCVVMAGLSFTTCGQWKRKR